ncbi:Protein of unknown function [Propionibacterium freudenreichii]|nr:Protein of unknown function [Propionibacterium freudenreichii subsp. freudenreichii]CEG87910.1 Protein of unknown function [Propionibacterium freudenreichii]CEG99393.1 Protein of unknown function [Propionibacterium freudenreichii]CEI31471.1 Protein of unknown function [Propionibacterium freudenreichii]
MAFTFNA